MNIKRSDIWWLVLFMLLLVPQLAHAHGDILPILGGIALGILSYLIINTLIKMLFIRNAKSKGLIVKILLCAAVSFLEIIATGGLSTFLTVGFLLIIASALLNLGLLALVGITGAKRLILYSLILGLISKILFQAQMFIFFRIISGPGTDFPWYIYIISIFW